ncbi:NAD(P)-dependent oxidoreductase [Agrobacterium sp. a22-2]|uniref:NAD-dependent epimerase/dehydratase family protein n=1 Tax=Agrobacterium sp. a22-2 TaxID=2283840 RepID=UPI001444B334|nr:NAD(P)-dependent oxidoreductase [Agrobacterium sp. a22-2]NKN35575.1 NAD(P)-dependent oxidoreductase [Agrobacterium sp. a22-2]
MKVLVSGGTGLVGRYIVEDLLAAGYDVTVGGRHAPQPSLFSKPVRSVPLLLDADLDQISAFDEAYFFVHAAFDHLPGHYRGGEGDDPSGFRRRNLDGTVSLFETARRAGVRRCVFLSSRAVYDGVASGTALDEDLELSPQTLYGAVKLTAEQVLRDLTSPGFAGASLRLTGVYGDLRPNKWDALVDDYLAGRPIAARAGSEVHGRDVGRAVRLMLETEAPKISGQVFNVSDIVADRYDILALVQKATHCPHPLPEVADKGAVAEMPTARIRALGWQPGGQKLLEETVRRLVGSEVQAG